MRKTELGVVVITAEFLKKKLFVDDKKHAITILDLTQTVLQNTKSMLSHK